jgi:hypothetical protein
MTIVNDIDRPDVNGTQPKMTTIKDKLEESLKNLNVPYLNITTDDNLCSSVIIHGSFDDKTSWSYGIFHNSRYFILRIFPKNKRYFADGDCLVTETLSVGGKVSKMRNFSTDSVEKCIEKVKAWISSNM